MSTHNTALSENDVRLRVKEAEVFVKGTFDENQDVEGVYLVGSTARGDCRYDSDIDLLVVHLGTDAPVEGVRQQTPAGRSVDVNWLAMGDTSGEGLLKDAYVGSAVVDGKVLLDRSGRLYALQQFLHERYMQPEWLRARIEDAWPPVTSNPRKVAEAVANDDPAEFCRTFIFLLWTACDVLLVRRGLAPCVMHGLGKLQAVAPNEYKTIVKLEDSSSVTYDDIAGHVAFLDEVGVTMHFGARGQQCIHSLMNDGQASEAFHLAWVCLGLEVKRHRQANDRAAMEADGVTARRWLDRMGWNRSVQQDRAGQLHAYAEHIVEATSVG